MFVRVRAPRYVDHRAALRDCRTVLVMFAGTVGAAAAALTYVQATPGLYLVGVHTRAPALVAALVIAVLAQGTAIGVRYRDHLQRQRRRAEAQVRERCEGCAGGCGVPVVFDLPRVRHRAA